MREILFRGKDIDGKWVRGYCIADEMDENKVYIGYIFGGDGRQPHDVDAVMVDPKTVCQYTGLTDKNGRKIFEGDILKLPAWITNHGEYAVCEYIDSKNEVVEIIGFALFDVNKKLINSDEWGEFEVNGNIFDNPDLLKE